MNDESITIFRPPLQEHFFFLVCSPCKKLGRIGGKFWCTCTMEMTWRSIFLHILQLCMLKSFLKPSQVRALSTMSSYGGLPAANALANIRVAPVVDGAIAGEAINAQNLWSEGPTMVYVVRRPG